MKIRNKKLLTKSIAMAIFMSSTLYTMPITYAAFNNNTLPDGGMGNVTINSANNIMNISQAEQNAVIQWKDFSIGANATVNFKGPKNFNTLNYVNSGNLSQIYGTINADKGNIYIVNPAGVQIGNSAQINVGSLYVSNNLNNDKLKNTFGETTINNLPKSTVSGGELMSLGNINATDVTFDGNRIVLDVDRVKNGQKPLEAKDITIKTTQTDLNNKDVVLGYTAYDSGANQTTYENKNDGTPLAKLEGVSGKTELTKKDGFMWVKDGEQLQAMNTNLGGNYAFRNSIDLNATADPNVKFYSVGLNDKDGFTGTLDGLGYEVYGLYIDEADDNTGLFAKTDGATIRNFNLISGSISGTTDNVGAVVGNANNTVIENVKNTINVTGANNVGGIIGTGTNVTLNGVVNAGAIKGNSNVGGLAGSLSDSTLKGESYNLGDIKGLDTTTTYSYNIGGLVGLANNSTIGNKTDFQIYNHLDVEGGYNVGGIVGNLENGSTVQNVSNDGNVKATGYTDGKYIYHTNNSNEKVGASQENALLVEKNVNVANVGGIVGNSNGDTINDSTDTTNTIKDVLNNGDVSTELKDGTDKNNNNIKYYIAGNVGGVVGSAVNTDISNATNKENDVRGAHNVGGIAGYLEDGKITKAINNGGDIMATGARNNSGFVKEYIRPGSSISSNESFITGNIGGIVGYMYGDSAYINTSANRGTVHTEDIADENKVLDTSKAANVGGIVGKIDRENTISIADIKTDIQKPTSEQQNKYAISNSYNTGNVRGYTGVGGVAGMMYNGEIVGSYNIGEIRSTRKDVGQLEPLNMGGIVGDSTEQTSAKISLYDVYNKGQIGDEEFVYKGRHVGGIAGRLSGDVEKSYNDGDIYNGANVTGGIAGWWVKGNIRNSFNTGNVTNYSTTSSANGSNVGGIAGGMGIYQGKTEIDHLTLENVYNLGTIRSIQGNGGAISALGGMIGVLGGAGSDGRIYINNVYTLGNLYADQDTYFHSIIGRKYNSTKVEISNAYYITPGNENIFKDLRGDLNDELGHTTTVEYENKNKENSYAGLDFINQSDKEINTSSNNFSDTWRVYEGSTTPILNAFLPETNGKFDGENSAVTSGSITGVQYGTAYDPLLTIINTNSDITLDWGNLGIYGDAGLAVYGGGLSLNNFKNSDKGVGLFGGIIYSDGALKIDSNGDDIGLGSFSKVYGSSIAINAGAGTVDAYGSIISTGNNTKGDINITGANVNTYGEIKTAVDGQTTTIYGIGSTVDKNYNNKFKVEDVENQNAEMPDVAEGYAYTTKNEANSNGDISISATNGDVNIYYGNMEKGIIDTQGNVTLVGNNVYVDSDMIIGGNLKIKASTNGIYQDQENGLLENINNDGEILVDISNIGKVQDANNANKKLHDFLHSFDKGTDNAFIFIGNEDNIKITADMWDNDAYNLSKYDISGHELAKELTNLDVRINTEDKSKQESNGARDITYIWVADGEQLKGIQALAEANSNVLNYNFALKNDINATDVDKYQSIGGNGTAFTGKFDGRGNRIIGLNVENKDNSKTDNVGVFGTIGEKGIVKNLKVYASTFKGYDNVGAIAGTNNGTIDNVTTLGNTVEALGSKYSNNTLDSSKYIGAAGGVVGTNNGTVNNATSRDSVIAGENTPSTTILTTAGGIVGINTGLVSNSQSHSAVTASEDSTYSLGGIVGVNTAKDSDSTDNKITAGLDNVNAYGVTSGIYSETGNKAYATSSNIGGIAGVNSGTLHDAYNESIVKGLNNIGGIAGINSGEISLIVNGASVTAEKNVNITDSGSFVGGLVGSTTGDISDGRNNGVITGVNYVGGLVGSNGEKVKLTNLTNDSSAEIIGEKYVGGIAGTNSGNISTTDTNLINRGSIMGNQYVGGIAGENNGTIENVNNDIVLNAIGSDAKYFGGVTGINTKDGTIKNATNRGNINASGATYVGGIAGENNGKLEDFNGNYGNVTGGDKVGGAVGKNTVDIDDAELVNTGKVKSNGGAGGIFAESTGDITNSDLSNSGTVTGGSQDLDSGTGGLIGINSGDIEKTSLRNEVNGNVSGVYNVGGLIGINRGTIVGGRDDADTYYKYQIYNNGTITATGTNSTNIGGLIGKNTSTGSLTAGYNTGNIVAGGSTNVGGIVGTNEGTVDQVFNTIMTVTGENTIKGKDNVGAIIGNNTSGTLTNAYSTNGGISALVGTGKENSNDYSKTSIWKTYTKDGNEYKVLKVFLTSVKYDPSKKPNFVYNGKDQSVNIDEAIKNGMLTDLSGKEFDAHNAAGLMGSNSHKDADIYTDWLYSGQIASSGKGETFNPNNLGYDIDLATGINDKDKIKIDKAKLTITGNDLDRIYGNTTIQNGGYGITIDGWVNGEDFSDSISLDENSIIDGALTGNKTGKVTNNAGDYTWTGNIIGSLKNYEFDTTVKGDSKVNKATIDIVAGDTTMNKGGNPAYSGSISGIVNGDSIDTVFGSNWDWGIKDSSLTDTVGTHKGVITINIDGKYYYFADQQELSNALKNYNVKIEAGDLTVKDNGGSVPIVPIEPIKPVVPGIWSHIYQDQWDRNRDFKERKAEFNFVDGAIPLDEAVEEV